MVIPLHAPVNFLNSLLQPPWGVVNHPNVNTDIEQRYKGQQ